MAWQKLVRNTGRYLDRVNNPFTLAEERTLFKFTQEADFQRWKTFQDKDIGGKSTISLEPSLDNPGTALISGNFSTELEKTPEAEDGGERRIQRSGFVGINSKESEADFDGLDEYDSLVFRVLGDGRKYIANIRTDNWITGGTSHDVWQAFLFARKGGWQEVEIPFKTFLLTWRGKVVEQEQEMNPDRILSIGISLAGGTEKLNPAGRFSLGLDWIKAKRLDGVLESSRM